jgi:thiamine-phosphate pyrophosphorylase
MKPEIDYSLYLVTDRGLMTTPTLEEAVEQAIDGGCTLVQLREKNASSREFYRSAVSVKKVTDRRGVPLIINDRLDIALASGAAGVHLGQSDLPAAAARRVLGPDKIVGVSASTPAQAEAAQAAGADYLGVGAMFPTGTKTDADIISMEELKKIRAAVSIPIVAIGGINLRTADGFAVVSAILARKDIRAAARGLRNILRSLKKA